VAWKVYLEKKKNFLFEIQLCIDDVTKSTTNLHNQPHYVKYLGIPFLEDGLITRSIQDNHDSLIPVAFSISMGVVPLSMVVMSSSR